MKTATITLHCTDNVGSTLQAFALQRFLRSRGIENEIIDYRPKYLFKYGNPIKRIGREILFPKDLSELKHKQEAFEKKYMTAKTSVYRTLKDLYTNPPIADVYITGSDQVWNPSYACGRDDAYYLRFAPHGTVKMAYAASIGKWPVPQKEIDYIYKKIQDFDYVSVRERTSKEYLVAAGMSSVDYVCDPVFLLDSVIYEEMKSTITKNKGRYIVVYMVQHSPLLNRLIERIKLERDCKVILIYGVATNCVCDEHIRGIGEEDFLAFIHDAEFVISSSFHATSFSHIFCKDFAVVLPQYNSARIEQLLEISGLTDRIVRKENDIPFVTRCIDYNKAGLRIKAFVEQSKQRFLDGLNACMRSRSIERKVQ